MKTFLVIVLSLAVLPAFAQLSMNPDKFLGNITTRGRINAPGIEYASLKAIVYDTKGNCYERVSQVTVKALINE